MTDRVDCALLTCFRNDWAASLVLACDGLRVATLPAARIGLSEAPNPFALPERDSADVVLVTGYWLAWLRRRYPERTQPTLAALRRCARAVVGVDGSDRFELGIGPRELAGCDLTIKFQGVFHDRDLYNYDVGPYHSGSIWSAKSRPKRERYDDADLARLRLSVPCTMLDLPGPLRSARRSETGAARTRPAPMGRLERTTRAGVEAAFASALRGLPIAGRRRDVHLVATMSHVQRSEAIRRLTGFSGARGLSLPEVVFPPGTGPADVALVQRTRREAVPLERRRIGRLRYVAEMARHRVVVAPTGYGELGQRHAWALRTGTALVCQDLSHVEMLYPLRDHENVVFCRPDLGDLEDRVGELLADEPLRRRIAAEGRRSFAAWSGRWRQQLDAGIAAHVRAALGGAAPARRRAAA